MSPTLDGLQDMLDTGGYANEHNLTFRTNGNPNKSKTKCMALLKKERPLKDMTLCGKKLPWIQYARHIGNTIVNNIDCMGQDIIEMRAEYITRNNKLLQELSFVLPSTECQINNVFDTHFIGSSMWKLFNNAKNLVEPISETKHIKESLMKRFGSFSNKISDE